jgi:hypothetical protein
MPRPRNAPRTLTINKEQPRALNKEQPRALNKEQPRALDEEQPQMLSRGPSPLRALATGLAVITLAVASGASAQDGCSMPEAPSMPDGSSASMEEMLAGQQAVKAFQTDNMDYMQCLEAEFQAAEARAKSTRDDAVRDSAEAAYRDAVEAYNAAVSTEEEVAKAFNVALREYKAANK